MAILSLTVAVSFTNGYGSYLRETELLVIRDDTNHGLGLLSCPKIH